MSLAGDHIQVLVGGFELTGDSNRLVISDNYAMHDVSSFGDAVHNFIAGQRNAGLEHAGYVNAAVGRTHPVLRGAEVQGVMSIYLGQNTAPVVGDPAYMLNAIQGKYGAMPETNRSIPFNAKFASRGGLSGWGVALTPPVSFTNSTDGAGVDNGAATTLGGAAYLHILQAVATDTYAITVQGATDSGFTAGLVTLATFTLNGSALGSERIAITGSIPRYTRFRAVRTGTAGNTLRIAASLVRF